MRWRQTIAASSSKRCDKAWHLACAPLMGHGASTTSGYGSPQSSRTLAGLTRISRLLRVAVASLLLSTLVISPVPAETYPIALLQGLDKVTARVLTVQAPVGDIVRFGTLEISAAVCEKRPPEETPDSAALPCLIPTVRPKPP